MSVAWPHKDKKIMIPGPDAYHPTKTWKDLEKLKKPQEKFNKLNRDKELPKKRGHLWEIYHDAKMLPLYFQLFF